MSSIWHWDSVWYWDGNIGQWHWYPKGTTHPSECGAGRLVPTAYQLKPDRRASMPPGPGVCAECKAAYEDGSRCTACDVPLDPSVIGRLGFCPACAAELTRCNARLAAREGDSDV